MAAQLNMDMDDEENIPIEVLRPSPSASIQKELLEAWRSNLSRRARAMADLVEAMSPTKVRIWLSTPRSPWEPVDALS